LRAENAKQKNAGLRKQNLLTFSVVQKKMLIFALSNASNALGRHIEKALYYALSAAFRISQIQPTAR